MRAYIFGSFNPVTRAHMQMGVTAMRELGLDSRQVIYVPAAGRYLESWKGYSSADMLPEDIRVKLLFGAVSPYGFMVNTAEVDGATTGRTYDTLRYLGLQDAILCLGMDNVAGIPEWYQWKRLLSDVELLVFERDGEHAGKAETKVLEHSCRGFRIVPLPVDEGISSTKARRCCREHDMEGLRHIVPENVYEYLKGKEKSHVYF